jgi:hypothetical protein
MDGIHIPDEVVEEARVPEDLDSGTVGPYRFPDPKRRRIAAAVYLGLAVVVVLAIPNSPGRLVGVAMALALALWHWASAWPLNVSPEEALTKAAVDAPFPIGHASAAVIFHGWRVRPRWHVVLYDSTEPPAQRALIVIDGVSGETVGEPYVEDIPETLDARR